MELQARKELDFPPYSRLILIELLSENPAALNTASEHIAGHLSGHVPEGTEVMGPVEAPVARRRGKHRMHILIKTRHPQSVKPYIQEAIDRFSTGKEDVVVDVDPIDLV